MKRCAHGKLKHPVGRRRCKKARSSKRGARRGKRRSYRGAAGIGLLGLAAIGAGAYFIVPKLISA
jgi:hypothetical protein